MYADLEQQLDAQVPGLPEALNQKFGFEKHWGEPRFQDIMRRLTDRIQSKSSANKERS